MRCVNHSYGEKVVNPTNIKQTRESKNNWIHVQSCCEKQQMVSNMAKLGGCTENGSIHKKGD